MADPSTPCLSLLLGLEPILQLQQLFGQLTGEEVYFADAQGIAFCRDSSLPTDTIFAVELNGQVVGNILVSTKDPRILQPLSKIIQMLTEQAAVAYQNKLLSKQMAHLSMSVTQAHEEERHRISRELHDEITQGLSSINLGLGLVMMDVERDGGLFGSLEQLQSQATELTRQVRGISQDLRPPALESFGLVPSLRQHIKRFGQQKGAPLVTLQVQGEAYRQPADVELATFRVVQESLNNAYKHSQATTITVTLTFGEEGLVLDVVDDGQGFEVGEDLNLLASEGHLGLIGMQERMTAIGGRWRVISAPGAGCRVWASYPRYPEESHV